MQKITVIAVGKCREAYFSAACAEYGKRLSAFCRLELLELDEHRLPPEPSQAEILRALEQEGRRVLEKIPERATVCALCVEGTLLSSEEFARSISPGTNAENGNLIFIIGGSHGLSEAVKHRSALRISLSAMTLPHHMARVVLLEQIYRAHCILNNRKYHK